MDAITSAFYERQRQAYGKRGHTPAWVSRALMHYASLCAIRYNRLFCQDRPKRGKSRVMQLSRMHPANVTLYQADERERREESEYSHSEGAHQ